MKKGWAMEGDDDGITLSKDGVRIVFDVKREDLRRKAYLVLGGHIINAMNHESYASCVQFMLIRLLFSIVDKSKLQVMNGDVGNSFPNSNTEEKI